MAKKISQTDHYEHSAIKIKLLKNYLEAYLSVIGNSRFFNVIHLYDLFCGEGLYPNGGKGSPIIITETIKEIRANSNNENMISTQFNFTANDIDETSYNSVKAYFEKNSDDLKWLSTIDIYNKDYKDFIPLLSEMFPRLKNEKAFVFIDPYGYSDISVIDIKDLLKGNNSEVLLFLPTQFMYRFDNEAAPFSLVQFINELDPNQNWTSSESGLGFINQLKKAFKTTLGDNYFVDTFVIAKGKNEFFCLFFFTSHILGFEKMLEAKWRIDEEEGRGWKPESYINRSGQLDVFAHNEREPDVNLLELAYLEFLKGWKTNKEIYSFTINNSYLPKHANLVLIDMFKHGKIEIEMLNGKKRRSNSFYVNYDNYKKEMSQLKIRLK